MPNAEQQRLLDSLIGLDGIYFTTIIEDETHSLGTRILYLKRAVSESLNDFLLSLDKLHNPLLTGMQQTINLEFIRSLKTINDLCFNNQMKFDTFDIRNALNHFFGRLGHINPDNFQEYIQNKIVTQIAIISDENHPEQIANEISQRELAETNGIVRSMQWRNELNLPCAQLHATSDEQSSSGLHEIATQRRPGTRFFNTNRTDTTQGSNVRRPDTPIASRPTSIQLRNLQRINERTDAVGNLRISRRQRQAITTTGQSLLVIPREISFFNELSASQLRSLRHRHSHLSLHHYQAAYLLLNHFGAEFSQIENLSSETLVEVFTNAASYNKLVLEANIPITFILNLTPLIRNIVLSRSNTITHMVNERDFEFDRLINISIEELQELINNPVELNLMNNVL